jgi:hypothetical protein
MSCDAFPVYGLLLLIVGLACDRRLAMSSQQSTSTTSPRPGRPAWSPEIDSRAAWCDSRSGLPAEAAVSVVPHVYFTEKDRHDVEAMYRVVIPEVVRRAAPANVLELIMAQAETLFSHCLVRGPSGEHLWGNVGGLLTNGSRVIDMPVDPAMAAGIVLSIGKHRGSFDPAARIKGQFLKATAMRLVSIAQAAGAWPPDHVGCDHPEVYVMTLRAWLASHWARFSGRASSYHAHFYKKQQMAGALLMNKDTKPLRVSGRRGGAAAAALVSAAPAAHRPLTQQELATAAAMMADDDDGFLLAAGEYTPRRAGQRHRQPLIDDEGEDDDDEGEDDDDESEDDDEEGEDDDESAGDDDDDAGESDDDDDDEPPARQQKKRAAKTSHASKAKARPKAAAAGKSKSKPAAKRSGRAK